MYAREKFGAVGLALRLASRPQGPWAEARGSRIWLTRQLFVRARLQPCPKYRNIKAALAAEPPRFSPSDGMFSRAKVFLPRSAKQFAAGSAPFNRGRRAFDLSNHSSLGSSYLRLFTSRGAKNALALWGAKFRGPRRAPARLGCRSIHVRVETHLTGNRINNLISADRYTSVSSTRRVFPRQEFAAAKEFGGACVYNAGAAPFITLPVGVRKNGRGSPNLLLLRRS
jgi:hypothetical protein